VRLRVESVNRKKREKERERRPKRKA